MIGWSGSPHGRRRIVLAVHSPVHFRFVCRPPQTESTEDLIRYSMIIHFCSSFPEDQEKKSWNILS